eukprot:1158996-Pelagomonas_calceolata.AAC.3
MMGTRMTSWMTLETRGRQKALSSLGEVHCVRRLILGSFPSSSCVRSKGALSEGSIKYRWATTCSKADVLLVAPAVQVVCMHGRTSGRFKLHSRSSNEGLQGVLCAELMYSSML